MIKVRHKSGKVWDAIYINEENLDEIKQVLGPRFKSCYFDNGRLLKITVRTNSGYIDGYPGELLVFYEDGNVNIVKDDYLNNYKEIEMFGLKNYEKRTYCEVSAIQVTTPNISTIIDIFERYRMYYAISVSSTCSLMMQTSIGEALCTHWLIFENYKLIKIMKDDCFRESYKEIN